MERGRLPRNLIRATCGGPLEVSGEIALYNADDELISEEIEVALCRCGASRHKPFCDGSHALEHFDDAGALGESHNHNPTSDSDGPLRIRARRDGPYLVCGPVGISDHAGADLVRRDRVALCRCGASGNKPFCDGSHRAIEFLAD